jgi:hypothetical protein
MGRILITKLFELRHRALETSKIGIHKCACSPAVSLSIKLLKK